MAGAVIRPELLELIQILPVTFLGFGAGVLARFHVLGIFFEELVTLDQLVVHLLNALVHGFRANQCHRRVAPGIRRVHRPPVHLFHHGDAFIGHVCHAGLHVAHRVQREADIPQE